MGRRKSVAKPVGEEMEGGWASFNTKGPERRTRRITTEEDAERSTDGDMRLGR